MNHLRGVGIDVTRISRFTNIIQKFEKNFIYKVLHLKEISEYNSIKILEQKSKYLASRWAFKEALVKATGNKSILFNSVFIEKSIEGKPFLRVDKEHYDNDEYKELSVKLKDFLSIDDSKIHISVSHEDDLLTAIVIVEI